MASVVSELAPIRILLVEDNPIMRDLFAAGLQRLRKEFPGSGRFELLEAEDGASAWEKLGQAEDVHLVVADLYLPILGGIALIQRIRETPRLAGTRILAMSASYTDARDRSLGAGADRFMQKPLQVAELLDSLRSVLKGYLR